MKPWEAEALEFDESNEEHLAEHQITPVEVDQVWWSAPTYVPNKKDRSATWLMLGETASGRRLTIAVVLDEKSGYLRPITGWNSTPGEMTRWRR